MNAKFMTNENIGYLIKQCKVINMKKHLTKTAVVTVYKMFLKFTFAHIFIICGGLY